LEKPTVYIIGTAWPFRGGIAAFNERLATAYQESGYEVTIINFTLQYPKILFPGKTQMASWDAPNHLNISQQINSVNPFNWLRVGNRIRREKPGMVIFRYWLPFMGPGFGTIARLIRMNRTTRVITIFDNIIPHEKRIGDRLFTKYFIRPIQAFVAMSDTVFKDIEQFDTKKPRRLCPHPLYDNFGEKVDKVEAKKHLELDPGTDYALFFGFIRDYKGLDLAIKAFGEEELRGGKYKLLVAGEFYADETSYLNLIKELGIESQLELRTDFIPDDEVKYYFSAADLVVQPYKTATQSGISQIAYHFNKPMIVTNVGGLPEIVPDGQVGFVVERESHEIARAILRFYEEDLEGKFEAGIETEKKKYSWQAMVSAINELKEAIN
jgi:glycosyltransferase involved in cell wall biosynthesis